GSRGAGDPGCPLPFGGGPPRGTETAERPPIEDEADESPAEKVDRVTKHLVRHKRGKHHREEDASQAVRRAYLSLHTVGSPAVPLSSSTPFERGVQRPLRC